MILDMTRAVAVTLLAVPFAVVSASLAAGPTPSAPGSVADPSAWGQWRGPLATGVAPQGRPAHRMERDEERPLEGGDCLDAVRHAGRLGRPHLPAHRRARLAGPEPRPTSRGAASRLATRTSSCCSPSIARPARSRGSAPRARRRRTKPRTRTTARGPRARPITDGEHVIAYFESRGIYAYDMNGTLVWEKDLGDKRMRNEFGEGSTPVLHRQHARDRLGSHQGASRSSWRSTSAPARSSGERSRDEIDTWATPLVVDRRRAHQVIVPAMNRVRSYDLETGKMVWEAAGHDDEPDSFAGVRRRDGVPDQRLPGQQPESHPARRREGRHHRHAAPSSGRWIATRRTCRRRCSTTASCTS